ncbi:pseudouridine synthase [Piptocephalis cylindrospora]|uniref:Pseudouridine synthase n=1 Tax=Piptocephalis cylindrospora TaxID=1907219 RepID=A0A4P9Y1J5_9FUNG|nr:pseudouridine synthase [Piptocephalis cylindrospora]|eukprot:RKP12382.1 pseudouridine synthase [Piptocephalis cylindrospora]
MRAARTDKGVHAAGQVVSLKMITDLPDLIPSINAHLPDQIRIWGYVRTIKSFHSKNQSERVIRYSSAEDMARKRAYRISPNTLALVREALEKYVGTWSYHNFTLGKAHGDMSANRFIISFSCSDPKILEGGSEWLSLKVHGQSFMIHQIRKMVGLIVALIRSNVPLSVIPKAFGKVKLNIPKAPGLGLLLEQTVFQQYNTRVSGGMGGVDRDAIDFTPYQDEMDTFKEKFIYDKIVHEELEHNSFDQWLQTLDSHADSFPYLNPEGDVTIPVCIPGKAEGEVKEEVEVEKKIKTEEEEIKGKPKAE